ncbi:MTMR9 [Cordylochernes scorpioides]|uniref:MTMR9 n=1 Tax=Cordylochernes scorpioides TaxID=51811 RepID=A0ABY6K1C0_9ARAC|nr:MTMR9 [Cordylochernes scorpioides]
MLQWPPILAKVQPHQAIDSVEKKLGLMSGTVILKCKDFQIIQLDIPGVTECSNVAYSIEKLSAPATPNMEYKRCSSCIPGLGALTGTRGISHDNHDDPQKLYPFFYRALFDTEENGWTKYTTQSYFDSLDLSPDLWKISDINKDFKAMIIMAMIIMVCPSYPPHVIVPQSVEDSDLKASSVFRHLNRFPVLSYYYAPTKEPQSRRDKHRSPKRTTVFDFQTLNASAFVIKTGSTTQWQIDLAPKEMATSDMRNRHHAALLRSSQPLVGPNQRRCKEDERLLNAALGPGSNKGFIVDTRAENIAQIARSKVHVVQAMIIMQFNFALTNVPEPRLNASAFVIKTGSTTQWQADLAPKEMAASDMRNRRHVQPHLTWRTNAAHPLSLEPGQLNPGGGFEPDINYPMWKRTHKAIEGNFAQMESLSKLVEACIDSNSSMDKWLSRLEGSGWLGHVSDVLSCACQVALCLHRAGSSVLVHGGEGLDSTLQVCSLAQVLLDPACRTLQGFQALVQREWIQAGHPFASRCRHGPFAPALRDHNPSFLLFLDCTYQAMIIMVYQQFPCSFEFNEKFLTLLFEHAYASQFGTFLGNCERDRAELKLDTNTVSLWTYLSREEVVGPLRSAVYEPNSRALWPSVAPQSLELWDGLFLRWVMDLSYKNKAEQAVARIKQHDAALKAKAIKLRRLECLDIILEKERSCMAASFEPGITETMLDEPEEWTKLLSATNPAETLTFLEYVALDEGLEICGSPELEEKKKEEEETEDDEVKEEIMMPTRGAPERDGGEGYIPPSLMIGVITCSGPGGVCLPSAARVPRMGNNLGVHRGGPQKSSQRYEDNGYLPTKKIQEDPFNLKLAKGFIITGNVSISSPPFLARVVAWLNWQADLAPKEMAASDMRNRRHVQPLLTWSTNAAHPVSLDQETLQGTIRRAS